MIDIILASNSNLVNSLNGLIKQFEQEKTQYKNTIELIYDDSHKVDRVWNKDTGKKDFYPKYKEDGKWCNGLGDRSKWLPYGFNSLTPANGEFCLWHEGEKATAYAIHAGLPSLSVVGSGAADDGIITDAVLMLKGLGYGGAIYILDNDAAAIKKAVKVQQIALKNDFIVLALPIKQIFPQAQKGNDFVEYLEHKEALGENYLASIKADLEIELEDCYQDLCQDYFNCNKETEVVSQVSQGQLKLSLTEAIEQAKEILASDDDELTINCQLEEIRQKALMSDYFFNEKVVKPLKRSLKEDTLRTDLEEYVKEEDGLNKIRLKMQICGRHHLRTDDFKEAVNIIKQAEKTPKQTVFDGFEIINQAEIAEKWLLPSFLPQGEMLLLAAAPKVGKSLLCSDIAYAVISGGIFLGETAKKGKVLYVSSDENKSVLGRRLMSRGFDLLPELKDNLRVLTDFNISNLTRLKEQLEDFKPSLVIIDSLTSISTGSNVSENDAAFAEPIYKLKDLLAEYNASCVLVHHENKNSLAKGQNKVAGSSRITAAVWGIAQLSGEGESSVDMGSNNIARRILSIQPREGEFTSYKLNMNVKPIWSEKGIFNFVCETTDPNGQYKTQGDQVIALLKQGVPLEYSEIQSYLGLGQSLSQVLQRLSNKRLISRRRSQNNPRRWVYFIDTDLQKDCNEVLSKNEESYFTAPPQYTNTNSSKKNTETIDNKGIEEKLTSNEQLVNTSEHDQQTSTDVFITPNPYVANDSSDELTKPSFSKEGGCSNLNQEITNVIPYCNNGQVIENREHTTSCDSPHTTLDQLDNLAEGDCYRVRLSNGKEIEVFLLFSDNWNDFTATQDFERFYRLSDLTFVCLIEKSESSK